MSQNRRWFEDQERAKQGNIAKVSQAARINVGLVARACLVVLFLIGAYHFEWMALRFLTSRAILHLSLLLGIPMHAVSFDTIQYGGTLFRFVVSCTLIDAFCASIPMVWEMGIPLRRNLWKLAKLFICLMPINIFRLELGFLLYAKGVPWMLSHDCISGITYFILLLWVLREARWLCGSRQKTCGLVQKMTATLSHRTSYDGGGPPSCLISQKQT